MSRVRSDAITVSLCIPVRRSSLRETAHTAFTGHLFIESLQDTCIYQ